MTGVPVLNDLDFSGGSKITGLPAAVAAGQAVVYEQLNSAIEGINWKDDVRLASTVNITVSGPGTTIDSMTPANGDRILLQAQTDPKENGIYIYNGSAVPMTRSVDANTFDELEGAIVIATEGTANGGSGFRQTQVNGVLGTNNVVWVSYAANTPAASESTAGKAEIATQGETDTGTDDSRFLTPLKAKSASWMLRKFAQNLGDGSSTSFNVDHNFGTRDVNVQVFLNSGNYDTVITDTQRTSTNRVVVLFASAPASNAYRVVVTG